MQTRAVEGARIKLKSLVFTPSLSEMLGGCDDVHENALASMHQGLCLAGRHADAHPAYRASNGG